MRGRFWAPAAALLALGFVFYFAVYGFRFAGVLLFLAAGVVLAFGVVDALRGRFPRFSRWATRLGLILVCLGLVLAAGTAGWVVSAGHGADDPEAQWVVVLGARREPGPSRVRPCESGSRQHGTILRAIRRPLPSFPARRATASPSRKHGACMTG